MKFKFSTILEYSPRGTSKTSEYSRKIVGSIKNVNVKIIRRITEIIKTDPKALPILKQLEMAVLVPVPRSEPLLPGALWPTKSICDIFISTGLGKQVVPMIKRAKKVPKSSLSYSGTQRPSVKTHLESFAINTTGDLLIDLSKIVILDDVLTLGRTSVACAVFLKQHYPDSHITLLSLVRTRSLVNNIEKIRVINIQEANYNSASASVSLPD